ncbi:protein kinase-like protein rad3 [Tricladium varicosporioides]|nr:protein kinase-like protein rad3 [Hymenoscyphus varicosporioides]
MDSFSRSAANVRQLDGNTNGNTTGPPGGFEIPPSTMAAQLIHNIATTNEPSREPEQDDLKRLMDEVSNLESNLEQLSDPSTKLAHKHKLIYVFTRAVLERFCNDDPFVDISKLVTQASDALDLFTAAVKDIPAVLGYKLESTQFLQNRGHEPLWLWLFPKILTLLGRRDCDLLIEKIKEFFYVSFQVISRSPKLWTFNASFYSYFKECISTVIEIIQSPAIIRSGRIQQVIVPSNRLEYLTASFPKEAPTDVQASCSYTISDIAHAFGHVEGLLIILSNVSVAAAATFDPTPAFEDHLAWIIDSFYVPHELRKRWQANPQLLQKCKGSGPATFMALRTLLSSLRDHLTDSIVRKGYLVLSILCADLLTELTIETTSINISSTLLQLRSVAAQHDSVSRGICVHLGPALVAVLNNGDALATLGNDFQNSAVALCQTCQISLPHVSFPVAAESFESMELAAEFRGLDLESFAANTYREEPSSKRRKIEDTPTDILSEVVGSLYSLLGAQSEIDLAGLSKIAESCFNTLNEFDQCKAIEHLARIPCAAHGSLSVTRNPDRTIRDGVCFLCEGASQAELITLNSTKCQMVCREASSTFVTLTKSSSFLNSRRTRVMAMFALRRLTVHFHDEEFIDLEKSAMGQWCLQSLNSSVRELRVAAGRTLPGFLHRDSSDDALLRTNRINVFALLKSFSDTGSAHYQETSVLAWGQIGRISSDEELNIVLLSLVGYLSCSNPVISGVAFNEITKLSKAKGLTVDRMFSSFWDTVAIEAVKDLLNRPQTTQLMADLLGISVSEFLVLTQSFTLPWLVLHGKSDVIKRISEARKDKEIWSTLMETSNLVAIMPLLLIQDVQDTEIFVMALFKAISSKFKHLDFAELVRIEPAQQAFNLLKIAAEADESKKSRTHYALQFLATSTHLPSDGNRKKANPLGQFFQQHILGLVKRLSEVVDDPRDEIPMKEKQRSLKAFEELVKAAKTHTRVARPQMCACLQSALTQKGLQATAFSAWGSLLAYLADDDVEAMLESTFSIIIQHWKDFNKATRHRSLEVLQDLIKNRAGRIRSIIFNLPSLSQFPELVEIEAQLRKWRKTTEPSNAFQIFSRRLGHENSVVVNLALAELKSYLQTQQSFLQASAVSEQPDGVISVLIRSILDTCVRFNGSHAEIATLSAECIGLVGCLDPNRVESVREQNEMVVISNFESPSETTTFVLFTLEQVIVPAFLSASDTVWQGFLSYVMQELLQICDFKNICAPVLAGNGDATHPIYIKWLTLPGGTRDTLTPFLTSKYSLLKRDFPTATYPIFSPENMVSHKAYNTWLRSFVLDLLRRPMNFNTNLVYPILCRAINVKDLSIAIFLLPYAVLHAIVLGTDELRGDIGSELLLILSYEQEAGDRVRREDMKLCVEAVFRVLDYLSQWIQEKQTTANRARGQDAAAAALGIGHVETVLAMIPPEVISKRAVECKSYSRALFYWEQHIRHMRDYDISANEDSALLEHLQDIYTQIDEPDGIEGISAHLHVLDIEQQILGHRKAGRWTAAQSWYEIKLAEDPKDVNIQVDLLTCLKESGQHDVLLNYVEGMRTGLETAPALLPFVTEAAWSTGRWAALQEYTAKTPRESGEEFNIRVGRALLALHEENLELFQSVIKSTREQIACSLSIAATASLGSCHDTMLKLHALTELEMIAGTDRPENSDRPNVLASLNRRLEVIGAYLDDKQYLLGLRRAAMQLSRDRFTEGDMASAWLTSARLARKGNAVHQSFNAVLHASELKDESSTIEHARLLWKEGHHRKAIQNLRGAIDNNAFISHNADAEHSTLTNMNSTEQQNFLTARAHLLLAKWLDSAGQTHSVALRSQYQLAAKTYVNWEKGHYYLGRHYNKLLETEKNLAPEQQAETYLTGETAKLVIENYLRSLSYGTKYIYQTLPRILTLWLDLGTQVIQPIDPRYGNTKEFVTRIGNQRKEHLNQLHARFNKYINKMPAYMFYTALPQIVARIAHPNLDVFKMLSQIIHKVVLAHPQQALWSLLAVCSSNQQDRKTRGGQILQSLRSLSNKKATTESLDMKSMIRSGEKLCDQLLLACNAGEFSGNRTIWASLSKDLGFIQKSCLPNPLAVPVERVLQASLPTLTDNIRTHKAFSRDIVTIDSFLDEVMVLSSLQKPRKLTALGSDGRKYGLMCKPKDDLRKDQRLMEFNSMINRSLKRDAESSRRQLYIKTYSVTPLNEECGLIEWVDGLKTLRDILLSLYKAQGISVDYKAIELWCEEATKSEDKLPFFTTKVLKNFPPIFHKWFVQQFPEPSAWFAARLRYTRSCAVMSMVGTILGLGDRHGENILFEEGNGGTFHVDFNCLFDKGRTFAKPERVPFRLTHNMVDAMGMYGYEGPFRKSSELTLKLLRQHQETLMTILEAFVYDPTLDLLKKTERKKKEGVFQVPVTAQGVLDSIQRKVRGLLPGESVPLGVEGQVDELIKQATNLKFLAGMYIGWCSFF